MIKKNKVKSKKQRAQFDRSETYRQLRTNIEFSSFKKDLKVISVTSSNPGEGKSSVSRNLAMIFAAKYENVVLIDCDLRRPSQHKSLNTTNAYGISNMTKDVASVNINDDQYFKRFNDEELGGKLYFVPAGSKVPNPQELLSSEKFAMLLEKLKTRFDYVIIDCPPISKVADAIPLSNLSDGTIFVCSALDTDKNDARTGLDQLERNGANILGCVLTKVEQHNSQAYKYKYGYY